jgi:hypothetical protein
VSNHAGTDRHSCRCCRRSGRPRRSRRGAHNTPRGPARPRCTRRWCREPVI